MLNKKKLYWGSQIIGWLVYVVFIAIFNILTGNELSAELIYSLLAIYLIGISISHAFRILIIKLNWMRFNILRLIPRILLANAAAGILVYLLKLVIIEIIILNSFEGFNLIDAFADVLNWTFIFLIWSLLYFLFHFITNYQKEEIKNLKWQAAKNEIELNKLKSQLNPHFVFNSMNSIRALIDEDPSLAKNAITQLSNVLRNSLLMGKQKLIPFGDEMKLVNDYLGLEKTRFEERLTIIKNIDADVEKFMVPPLMVQTIVENGIKHGTSKLTAGGVLEINAVIDNNKLIVTICNSGKYDKNEESDTGFGIVNTVQRLQLLYGEKAIFKIENEKDKVIAQLIIPKETIL